MIDKSNLVELARLAHDAFDARRRYEWRINFSLWGGLAAIGYWANNAQVRILDSPCLAVSVGVLLVVLYVASLLLINYGHSKDKAWKHYYMKHAMGKDAPEPMKYPIEWTQIAWCACQTGFTVLLTCLVLKVLLHVPAASP